MIVWLLIIIILFAIIFAINSSIHSFLVVKYAKKDKVAVSVGFYYMSNACGRLLGTIGSGLLYSNVGSDKGNMSGTDATMGMFACFVASTICSILAAVIVYWIDDEESGLKCGPCVLVNPKDDREVMLAENQ